MKLTKEQIGPEDTRDFLHYEANRDMAQIRQEFEEYLEQLKEEDEHDKNN